MEVIGEYGDVDGAISAIQTLKPNLIFLDIQMPGKNGFELLHHFPNPDFGVIFITSYDQFAIKAIRFNVLDYLLKPVDIDELIQAVQKFQLKNQSGLSFGVSANTLSFNEKTLNWPSIPETRSIAFY